jgi:hypothetical protein
MNGSGFVRTIQVSSFSFGRPFHGRHVHIRVGAGHGMVGQNREISPIVLPSFSFSPVSPYSIYVFPRLNSRAPIRLLVSEATRFCV